MRNQTRVLAQEHKLHSNLDESKKIAFEREIESCRMYLSKV